MKKSITKTGYFKNGIPYNKFGSGSEPLIVFQGLMFENTPLKGMMERSFFKQYSFLSDKYYIYIVTRKKDLPQGYSIADMAGDYAEAIKEEFQHAIDIIGISTGGSIAQQFAADYPKLVRKLIIHSSAYTLAEKAKQAQLQIGEFAVKRLWKKAYSLTFSFIFSSSGITGLLLKPFFTLASYFAGSAEKETNPSDLVITIHAEDKFNFFDQLKKIKAPVLLAAGDRDPFYSVKIFQETAKNIPNAKLCLYPHMSHPAKGKEFEHDVITFFN